VTSDHGEEFREHGGLQHGTALYEESVRIPLVMAGPGLPAGRVVSEEVSLVDVAPTVLELLGLAPEARFEGRSLLGRLAAGADAREIVLELRPSGEGSFLRRHEAGIVHERVKVLVPPSDQEGGAEAFDLRHDPDETRPSPPTIAQETAALHALLAQRQQTLASRAGLAETVPIDEATRGRLRALGYVH
jgi:arylsulfatase A-like enzyme